MKHQIIKGLVIHGFDKGKQIGFPTFNLGLEEKYPLEVMTGVWCSMTYWQHQKLPSITHIGPIKIFGEENIRVETHILDWDEDLYGEDMQVELLQKIRDTRDFTGLGTLVAQIKDDVVWAKNYFKLD